MMRIIIAGSRSVSESDVREAVQSCSWAGFVTAVVSGTARGADTYGEMWAKENRLDIHRYPADWKKHGKRAGPLRNAVMSESAEGLIAVWDGESRGTRSMIDLAAERGLRIAIFNTQTRLIEERAASGRLDGLWEAAEERAAMKEFSAGRSRRDAEREAGREVVASFSDGSSRQT